MSKSALPTFSTCSLDEASAVFQATSEMPEVVRFGSRYELNFFSLKAPGASEQFQHSHTLQGFVKARRLLLRAIKEHQATNDEEVTRV